MCIFKIQRKRKCRFLLLYPTIAEELRGLAVETNVLIMSATQTTRTGYTSTDIGLEDTSESFGLHATRPNVCTHLDRGTRRP